MNAERWLAGYAEKLGTGRVLAARAGVEPDEAMRPAKELTDD